MNCLTVECGVETDAFGAPLFLPHPKDSIAKRNQRSSPDGMINASARLRRTTRKLESQGLYER